MLFYGVGQTKTYFSGLLTNCGFQLCYQALKLICFVLTTVFLSQPSSQALLDCMDVASITAVKHSQLTFDRLAAGTWPNQIAFHVSPL